MKWNLCCPWHPWTSRNLWIQTQSNWFFLSISVYFFFFFFFFFFNLFNIRKDYDRKYEWINLCWGIVNDLFFFSLSFKKVFFFLVISGCFPLFYLSWKVTWCSSLSSLFETVLLSLYSSMNFVKCCFLFIDYSPCRDG